MEKQRDKAAQRVERKLHKGHLGDSMIEPLEDEDLGLPVEPTDEPTEEPTEETTPTE
jgi:hypothetical protein